MTSGLPATVTRLLWWTTLSSFGSGLVLPMTALFLARRTSLGVGGTAMYFAVAAAVELGVSLTLTAMRTRVPPGLLAACGYVALAAGYTLLGILPGRITVLAIAAVVGVGRGASASGLPAFLRQAVDAETLRDVFARRYRAMNTGLGAGLLTATVALSLAPASVLPFLFVANGLTFVPLALYLLHRRAAVAGMPPADKSETQTSSPARLSLPVLVRRAGLICLMDFFVFFFAYSQFDSSLPLTATRISHASLGFVSAVVAVNTVAVIVMQPAMTRVLKRWSPGRGLQMAVASWLAGYAMALATSMKPGVVSWAGLIVLAMLFACAEAAYASSFQPWLFEAVPEGESTRVSAMSNMCSSVGLSLGPSMGVLLISTGKAPLVWGTLVAGCAITLSVVSGRVSRVRRA